MLAAAQTCSTPWLWDAGKSMRCTNVRQHAECSSGDGDWHRSPALTSSLGCGAGRCEASQCGWGRAGPWKSDASCAPCLYPCHETCPCARAWSSFCHGPCHGACPYLCPYPCACLSPWCRASPACACCSPLCAHLHPSTLTASQGRHTCTKVLTNQQESRAITLWEVIMLPGCLQRTAGMLRTRSKMTLLHRRRP